MATSGLCEREQIDPVMCSLWCWWTLHDIVLETLRSFLWIEQPPRFGFKMVQKTSAVSKKHKRIAIIGDSGPMHTSASIIWRVFHHFKGLSSKSLQEKETRVFFYSNDIANVQGDRNSKKIQARIRYGWQLWQKQWAQRLQDSLKFTHLHRAAVLLGIDFLMNLQNNFGRSEVWEH